MAWPPRFLFVTGRLCLDFAQTGGEGKWALWERWKGPADLADWLRASSLGLSLERVRPAELALARRLRTAVREAVRARLRGGPLPSAVVDELEERAARPDLVPVLVHGRAAWARKSTARQALASVARDAIDFFGTDACLRLRECQNPRCPLFFVDTSRPGKRAWCTMRRCGNLEKTSRYRTKRARARTEKAEENP